MSDAPTIAVVGLGKLGLGLAGCLAARGFVTVGHDIDPATVAAVNRGESPIVEPGLAELLARVGGRTLRATSDPQRCVEDAEATIVMVPTPSEPDGAFSTAAVEAALAPLGRALATSAKPWHLFVVGSTVVPGAIEGCLVPLLERESGRRLGPGFGVCYVPEFVALGNVVRGFLEPDVVVVGESDPRAGDAAAAVHARLCTNAPPIARMSLASAELAKVALNAYLTVKISFANTLANLCERIPETDVDHVCAAIGLDHRIGAAYLRGGPAFGGPCFPRDTRAFIAVAERVGNETALLRAVERVNETQHAHLLDLVRRYRQEGQTVGVLGLAFKPDSPVVVDSTGMRLVAALVRGRVPVVVHDPLAMAEAAAVLGGAVDYAGSVAACVEAAGLCVLTTPDPAFHAPEVWAALSRPTTVIDCWRTLDRTRLPAAVRWIGWGHAPPPGERSGHRRAAEPPPPLRAHAG